MTPFTIITPGDYASRQEAEIAIQSFAKLYANVTNKHRKRIHFVVLSKGNYQDEILQISKKNNIADALRVIPWYKKETIAEIYNEAALLFLPTNENILMLIQDALSKGVSILSYDAIVQRQLIDHSCGILVQNISKEHSISTFAEMLQMLYFDPEARKMLRKGALRKYNSVVSWQKEPAILQKVA